MYAVYHGPAGLKQIATRANNHARVIASSLVAGGFTLASDTFFDTVVVNVENADAIISKAVEADSTCARWAKPRWASPPTKPPPPQWSRPCLVFGVQLSAPEGFELPRVDGAHQRLHDPPDLQLDLLQTQMMRYLRRLSDRDLALDRTMIPLARAP